MINKRLSRRLKLVASYLPKSAYFADIGSDHAYLPVTVCSHDLSAKALAGEINEGPFKAAKQHVGAYGLHDRIEVRRGDGLTIIEEDPVKQVTIAGMGGSLIRSILETGEEYLKSVDLLILQPNVDSYDLRHWMVTSPFSLVDEQILEEDGHIYEVLVAKRGQSGFNEMSYKQLLLGPILMKEKSKPFISKWKRERDNKERIVEQMKLATSPNQLKIDQFIKDIQLINEVIEND
ncbi:tRNA (adenine22-N1)-methyltransferase [Pelagirhabdus alkalitolerans]|uniref:tRNA (Adenine22-N1)-methyltransferase n=1 Tax=Pelagirhabdus alkalitolerans TaxID=1612202 RepID=A0A1G6HWZ2_9BACI|nr:tRNA (adenine22-N1)-methyltransferase [Pelagirhabdus alkalitolerans]